MNETVIPSIIAVVRSNLPVGGLSDAEIGFYFNLVFLFVSILLYSLSRLSSPSLECVESDSRAIHDLATENKRLRVDITKKDSEIKRISKEFSMHEARAQELEEKNREHVDRMAEIEQSLEEEQKAAKQLKDNLDDAKEKIKRLENELEEAKELRQKLDDAHSKDQAELNDAKKGILDLQNELTESRTEKAHLVTRLEEASEHLKEMEKEKKGLEEQLSGMAILLREEGKTVKQDKSPASGGWSDCDFGEEQEVDAKVLATTRNAELREMIKLRTDLLQLQKDYEKTQYKLERVEEEKKRLEGSIHVLKADLEYKTKEVEARDADRRGADERVNQLLSIIQDTNNKIRDKETMCDKLNDQVQKLQGQIYSLSEENHLTDAKIRAKDDEVKKWRNDYFKLESTSFSKESEYLRKIQSLQTLSSLPQPLLFDLSHNLSVDSRGETRGSLWDQPDLIPAVNKVTSSPDNEPLSRPLSSAAPVRSKSGRSRRSDRVVQEWSSGAENMPKPTDNSMHRRRSRSHGRNSMDKFSMLPPGFMPMPRML